MIDFKQIIPLHYMECNPKRKRLVRLGCAALALTLAMGSVSFLRGWAAEDDACISESSCSDFFFVKMASTHPPFSNSNTSKPSFTFFS